MIDTVVVIVPVPHLRADISGGLTLTLSPDGDVETGRERYQHIQGSWDSRTTVCSFNPDDPWRGFTVRGDAVGHYYAEDSRHWIRISGSPAKWRLGHNCYGTDDPGLIFWWVWDVLKRLRLHWGVDPDQLLRRIRLQSIDTTTSYRLPSDDHVARWLRSAEVLASMKYRGRGNVGKGQTLYFGKHSQRWAAKFYSKTKEMIDHPIPDHVPRRDEIINWSHGILRFEVRFLRKELKKRNLKYLHDLSSEKVAELRGSAMAKINFSKPSRTPPSSVSASARGTFYAWTQGIDLQSELPRSTWYRHRRELLEHDIDIAVPCDFAADQVDIAADLVARPAAPPSWATDSRFRLCA